jgi:hypothetical protein
MRIVIFVIATTLGSAAFAQCPALYALSKQYGNMLFLSSTVFHFRELRKTYLVRRNRNRLKIEIKTQY